MNIFPHSICHITNTAKPAQAGSVGYGESKMPASMSMPVRTPLLTQDWVHFDRTIDGGTNTGRLMV
jgi:hypothetical protein